MLENIITLFELQNESSTVTNKSLILNGCHGILFPKKLVYSDPVETTGSLINSNDFDFGYISVEFRFENNSQILYEDFYSAFFSIRTNNGAIIKINANPGAKLCSKINRENKLALSVCYYFKSESERAEITNCNFFFIEGFFSFKKKTNICGIMCRLIKKGRPSEYLEFNCL